MNSVLQLFKAVPIEGKSNKKRKIAEDLLQSTLSQGFVFAPEVIANHSNSELQSIAIEVAKELGLSGEQMNASFHKSWEKVRNAPMFQLVLEQLMHYFTTYGFESVGVYNKDSVYIPDEQLQVPALKGGIRLTVIKGYTKAELKEKLIKLLSQGIALKEDTVKDMVDVALFVGITSREVEKQVKNREVACMLFDHMNMVPENPVEFLRFMIYKATDKTLIIINKETIQAIKSKEGLNAQKYFRKYQNIAGLENLAKIFLRFKPLFLAFKHADPQMRPLINKLRKLAITYHEPMTPDYLNNVTAMISRDDPISITTLSAKLNGVSTFRKVRLASALQYRTLDNITSIMYKVRNGKSYATDYTPSYFKTHKTQDILKIVMDSIITDIKKNVDGKTFYIPSNVVYALPATEKQFSGNIPSGSYISVKSDMVIGVHWDNIKDSNDSEVESTYGFSRRDGRVDLDLSLQNEGERIGWNASYRTGGTLFSGDMTDAPAPNGATELFYIGSNVRDAYTLYLNCFAGMGEATEIPYKLIVAGEKVNPEKFRPDEGFGIRDRRPYMVDPNNVACVVPSKIKEGARQLMLGLVVADDDSVRFYFGETSSGNAMVAKLGKHQEQARQFMFKQFTNSISLNDILVRAGARIVKTKSTKLGVIDLSPEALQKDTILNLLSSSPSPKRNAPTLIVH